MHEIWLKYAEMDLESAQFLMGMIPKPIEIICYHCEQSAEKLLKGVLAYNNIDPPKTHDLVLLYNRCMEIDNEFQKLINICLELTPYATQIRYPSNIEVNDNDANYAVKLCLEMNNFVTSKLL